MTEDSQLKFRSFAHAALRIAAGLVYFTHGSAKLFRLQVSVDSDPTTAPPTSRLASEAAGIIENRVRIGVDSGTLHSSAGVHRIGRNGGRLPSGSTWGGEGYLVVARMAVRW